jgi:uncharacterized protein YdeI (YjbR/CyaY-like superfamily)
VKPENIRFFGSAAEFRAWLDANHAAAPFQWVGFYKKSAGPRGMTYDEAVIEALCFGWIDGQSNRVDDLSITVRFSPRRPASNWSELNIARVKELQRAGRMHPAGMRVFEARRETGPGAYTYETRPPDLPPELAEVFRAHPAAWEFWRGQTPSYRKSMTWWVVSAKRDETRLRRLAALIDESAARRKISEINLPKLAPTVPAGRASGG